MPIPVLGPDLIDLRTLEITAERTAMGLVEAREATLVKPAKIPAPQPGVGRAVGAGRGPAAAAAKGPSKIDLIRAKVRGEEVPRGRGRQRRRSRRGPGPAGRKPAAKPAKKIKMAEARPSLALARRRRASTDLADRLNAEFGAGTADDRPGRPARPGRRSCVEVALYLRDRNPIRYDYLASLQSVHYEDCIEVNYHLDSTDAARQADRAARPRRRGRGAGRGAVGRRRSGAGPISRSARSTT